MYFNLLVRVNMCPKSRDVSLPYVTLLLNYLWILFFFFLSKFLDLKTGNPKPLDGDSKECMRFCSFLVKLLRPEEPQQCVN